MISRLSYIRLLDQRDKNESNMFMRSFNLQGLIPAATIAAALIFASAQPAVAAEALSAGRIEKVQFANGATAAAIKGELRGDQYVDYQVRGGAGQTLAVVLKPSNPQNYFNVNPPANETSMFVGNLAGNQFKRVLPMDGDYTIRVYLMRAAARRNESSSYMLNISLEGRPLAANPSSKDAVIRGTPFNASANTACARPSNPQLRRCDIHIIRRGFDGSGTIEVNWPDGMKRNILFVRGNPLATDSRDAMTYARKGEVTVVYVGKDEQVEIPDVFVTGG